MSYTRRIVLLLALTIPAFLWQSYAQAQTLTPLPEGAMSDWLQHNLLAIAVMVFHFGVSWREFLDHRRRITRVEARLDDEVPTTYMRQDVLDMRLRAIEHALAEWHEAFSFLRRRPDSRSQ